MPGALTSLAVSTQATGSPRAWRLVGKWWRRDRPASERGRFLSASRRAGGADALWPHQVRPALPGSHSPWTLEDHYLVAALALEGSWHPWSSMVPWTANRVYAASRAMAGDAAIYEVSAPPAIAHAPSCRSCAAIGFVLVRSASNACFPFAAQSTSAFSRSSLWSLSAAQSSAP